MICFTLQLEHAQRHGHRCPDCNELWACVRPCSSGTMFTVDVHSDTPMQCSCDLSLPDHVHKCPECDEPWNCDHPCELPVPEVLLEGEPDGGFMVCAECILRAESR